MSPFPLGFDICSRIVLPKAVRHRPVLGWSFILLRDEVVMNCIDAIEGTAKCIIDHLHTLYIEERLDDSEYIRCVKTIINATDTYLNKHQEIITDAGSLTTGLYAYSKELWLKCQNTEENDPANVGEHAIVIQPNDGYQDYYYDYIYSHGLYPR